MPPRDKHGPDEPVTQCDAAGLEVNKPGRMWQERGEDYAKNKGLQAFTGDSTFQG